MKWAILIGALVEMIGAIILYFNAQSIFPESDSILPRMYAVAIAVLAFICFKLYQDNQFENPFQRQIYLGIMFFHAALSFICFSTSETEMPLKLYATISHLGMFIILLMAYLRDIKADES